MQQLHKKALIEKVNNAVDRSLPARIMRGFKNFSRKALVRKMIKNAEVKFTETEMFTGDKMHIVVPDNVSTSLYLNGCFEADDTKALIEVLEEGDSFIDIGAHIGYYSVLASNLVGNAGRVISFEPTPSTYSLLKKNTDGKSNIKTENLAIYSVQTNMEFNDYGLKYMVFNSFQKARLDEIELQPNRIQVQTTTLDNYCRLNHVKPSFIKIDAESVELHILEGAIGIVKNYMPRFLIEVGDFEHIDAGSTLKIIRFLTELGYEVFEFNGQAFVRHTIREGKYPTLNLYFFKK